MAFLGELTKKTKSRKAAGVRMERDERDPATVTDLPWIFELDPKYVHTPSGGKWMFFYEHSAILPMWRKCQSLYRAGELEGVESLKVSTMHDRHKYGSGVIILYCGPTTDELRCMRIGKMIIEKTGYNPIGKRMHYKRDVDTLRGRHLMTYTIQINDDGTPNVDLEALEKELQSRPSRGEQLDSEDAASKSKSSSSSVGSAAASSAAGSGGRKKKFKKKKKKKQTTAASTTTTTAAAGSSDGSGDATVTLAGGTITEGVLASGPVVPGASKIPIPVDAASIPLAGQSEVVVPVPTSSS